MKLRNTTEVMETIAETLPDVSYSRYGGVCGTMVRTGKNSYKVKEPFIEEALKELSVVQNGIDFIVSMMGSPEEYFNDMEFLTTGFNGQVKYMQGQPLQSAEILFTNGFGGNDYDIDLPEPGKGKIRYNFQGLSEVIAGALSASIKDLSYRKLSLSLFLCSFTVIDKSAHLYSQWLGHYKYDVKNLYDRHGWRNILSANFNSPEEYSACEMVNISTHEHRSNWELQVNTSHTDLVSMFNSGIKIPDLKLAGKKCIVTRVEPVCSEEVTMAAKKIKTVVDLNGIRVYKVVKGLKVIQSGEVCDYWGFRSNTDKAYLDRCIVSCEGVYIAVLDTPETTFTSMGTTLGRAIASSSKRLQDGVMASLDLDALI